jgi:site-specific DNA-cytosine methylase
VDLDSHTLPNGTRIRVGSLIELKHESSPHIIRRQGDFVHIHYIREDVTTEEVVVGGLVLKRTSKAKGGGNDGGTLLERKVNEVYLPIDICDDDASLAYEQNLVEVPVDDILMKRFVNVTNTLWPDFSYREQMLQALIPDEIAHNECRLACRWLLVSYYRNNKDMIEQKRQRKVTLRRFIETEVDTHTAIPDALLAANHLNADGEQDDEIHEDYTMIDSFCGAGGVSIGARQAGVTPTAAFDSNMAAIKTYTMNQENTDAYLSEVHDFIEIAQTQGIRAVILHMSPPCQAFSRANRTGGQNLEANQAVLFSIERLVRALRPRIVTIEETEWLARYWKDWWTAAIRSLTSQGYGTTWTIVKCCDFGVPQNRERVICIASAPGTVLPPLPMPTHGPPGSGLLPYVTLGNILENLARHPDATFNELTRPHAPKARDLPPYDPYRLVPCLTTGGSDGRPGTYHPSGTRDFTLRELAMLQTVPWDYEFADGLTRTDIRRQIGNMVPVALSRAMFASVCRALRREDAERAAEQDL